MAIKGTVTIPGELEVPNTYIKINIGSISELKTPTFDQSNPPVQTGWAKEFIVNYSYDFRKNGNTLAPFYQSSDSLKNYDPANNIFNKVYADLATKLGISSAEV